MISIVVFCLQNLRCRILYFSKERRGAYWFSYLKMPRLFEGNALCIKLNAIFSKERHGDSFWSFLVFEFSFNLYYIWGLYYFCGFNQTICQTQITLGKWLRPQTSNSNELGNQRSSAERWTIKEIRPLLNSVLTYSLLTCTEHPL